MQMPISQSPTKVDICQTTPPMSPIIDTKPTITGSLSPISSPRHAAPALVHEAASRTTSSSTTSSKRRISVPGVQFLLDKIRTKLLSRHKRPVEQEQPQDSVEPSSPSETRYYINDKDVRSIIEFVLSQSRENSTPSSRTTSSDFHSLSSRVPSSTATSMHISPPSTLGSSCTAERDDVLRRLRELTSPIISPTGTLGPQTAIITAHQHVSHHRVMSATVPEPTIELTEPFPNVEEQQKHQPQQQQHNHHKHRHGSATRTSDTDIWNLCRARPSTAARSSTSCRTKPAPPTLRTSPVRATTTLQAVQDHHAFGSWVERRRSVVSRSDLSVYSHGGESSTDGLTSFPKLRRRRSSEWRTPVELMDRQNDRPDDE